jgi:hypothetical protein
MHNFDNHPIMIQNLGHDQIICKAQLCYQPNLGCGLAVSTTPVPFFEKTENGAFDFFF